MNFPSSMIIGGEAVPAADGGTYESINPADESVICRLPAGGVGDANAAVAAARKAFDQGDWPTMAPARRGRVLRKLADLVRKHRDELAQLETLDVGKTAFDSGKIEIPTVANILDYYAGFADKITGDTLPSEASLGRVSPVILSAKPA